MRGALDKSPPHTQPFESSPPPCTIPQVLLPLKAQLRHAEKELATAKAEQARLQKVNGDLTAELDRAKAMNRVLAQVRNEMKRRERESC